MNAIASFLQAVIQVLTFAILVRILISWFPMNPGNPLIVLLWQITEPILAPFRRILPRMGMFDLSPMVAIIVLQVIGGIIVAGVKG